MVRIVDSYLHKLEIMSHLVETGGSLHTLYDIHMERMGTIQVSVHLVPKGFSTASHDGTACC